MHNVAVYRPTHPNVSVSLTLQGDEGPIDLEENSFVKFNPQVSPTQKELKNKKYKNFTQVGFVISPVLPEHSGQYWCVARRGGKTSEYGIMLNVLTQTRLLLLLLLLLSSSCSMFSLRRDKNRN